MSYYENYGMEITRSDKSNDVGWASNDGDHKMLIEVFDEDPMSASFLGEATACGDASYCESKCAAW